MSTTAIQTAPTTRMWSGAFGPWLVLVADVLALELALYFGYCLRIFTLRWFPNEFQPDNYRGLILGVLVVPLAYFLLDLYPGYGINPVERFRKRILASLMVFSLLLMWDYLIQQHQWSRGIMLGTAVFSLVLSPVFDEIVRDVLGRLGLFGIPILVIGAGRTGVHVTRYLRENPSLGYRPVALFDDDSAKTGQSVLGVPVVGGVCDVFRFEGQVETAVLAIPGMAQQQAMELLKRLPFSHVVYIPGMLDFQSMWITPRDLGGMLGLDIHKNLLWPLNHRLKRLIDLGLGTPAWLLSLPIIGISALLVKVLSPGPAVYRQAREGKGGTSIEVIKLRTMHCNAEQVLNDYLHSHPTEAEEWRRFYKLKSDPRLIPYVGRVLRRFSIDELPQLWQVVRGELSLVGPRPFPDYHLRAFKREFRSIRSSVAPGLTGLWQVSARSDGDTTQQEALDRYYIHNWSLWLDLYILVRTASVVILSRGAY